VTGLGKKIVYHVTISNLTSTLSAFDNRSHISLKNGFFSISSRDRFFLKKLLSPIPPIHNKPIEVYRPNVRHRRCSGEYNVLVATSVAEEGLDIAECDLVVFYETVASIIKFIQRQGRTGRKRAGTVASCSRGTPWTSFG